MNKRTTHHYTRHLKPAPFVALAIASGAVCIFALRANNQHMITLREAVYTADKNNTDTQKPLQNLQAYVTTHMNTELTTGNTAVYPPIQLKYTYDRLVQAQSDAAAAANTQLYTEAQHYCEQQDSTDFSGHNRVPCIEQYVQAHDTQLPTIPDALYKFDFVSPKWSPDLAGWSLLATIVFALLSIVSFIVRRWTKSR